jgi:VCBS repeat-containing protein
MNSRFRNLILFTIIIIVLLSSNIVLAIQVQESIGLPPGFVGKAVGPMAKAGNILRRTFREFQAHIQKAGPESFIPSHRLVTSSHGKVLIDAVAAGDVNLLVEDLKKLGLQNFSSYGSVVSGMLPIARVNRLVSLGTLRSVSAALKPLTSTGLITSEGVQALQADLVHQNGITGSGVMVGVLSDSYDQQGDATNDQLNNELPTAITVLDDNAECQDTEFPFPVIPCTDEGRAMLQILYDVAPGAALAFHTAFGGKANFASGIEELAAAGADVIVDDVMYFAEPWFQDGIIAQAVDNVYGQGVAYFSAAGNFARKSYASPFVPSGERLIVQGGPLCPFICEDIDRGELHDFDPAPGNKIDYTQRITIPPGRYFIIALQWDQPFGASQSDYDLYLVDQNSVIVASSIDDNIQLGDPFEVIAYQNTDTSASVSLDIMVTHFDGPQAGRFKYIIYGGEGFAGPVTEEFPTNSPTLAGHANAVGAEAVGAAFYQETPEFGGTPPLLEFFSSAGGTPILFDTGGERFLEPVTRLKPEVVGIDGVSTTFFGRTYESSGPGPWADDGPAPNFYGTSAAAPHIAAVAALMLERNPNLAPTDIYNTLESTTVDMGPTGFDFDTGFGLVDAAAAVAALQSPVNRAPIASDDTASIAQGKTLSVSAPGPLGNDNDPDGDPLSASLVDGVSHGQLDFYADGSYRYTPDSGYVGMDQFTYTASDGTVTSNIATVFINVTNTVPDATNDAYSVQQDVTLDIAAPGVLANDSDPDGDALTVALPAFSDVTHGTLVLNADGSFSYTPNNGYTGSDQFTYQANDGAAFSTATVSIEVTSSSPPALGSLDGLVTDAGGKKLGGVNIAVLDEIEAEVFCQTMTFDGKGKNVGTYTCTEVPLTLVKVRASKDGYITQTQSIDVSTTSTLNFSLNPETTGGGTSSGVGSISGTVYDSSGTKRIKGASVRIEETGASNTTNKRGKFSFTGVPVGQYNVTASDGSATDSRVVEVTDGGVATVDLYLQ